MEALSHLLEALVIALREGIEAALAVGIVLTYLTRTGRPQLRRPVWIGIAVGILSSIGVAIAFQAFSIDPENELREGVMYFAAGLMVSTLVIWMWRQGKNARGDIEDRLGKIVADHKGVSGSVVGLFFLVFFMVLREGVETVMFMFALGSDGSESLAYNLIGGSMGVALAVGFGILLFKGSLRINLRAFFSVTSAVLLILALKLLAGGIHEWTEVDILPANDLWMNLIGWIAKDSTSTIIMMALIGLPSLVVFWESRKIKPSLENAESAAERRSRKARAKASRSWGKAIAVLGVTIMLALGGTQAAIAMSRHDPSPEPVQEQGERALVPMAELADMKLHKYTYSNEPGAIRFMIIFDGSEYHAAFDTCEICPAEGFLQEGEDTIVCKNCNAPIDIGTLDEGGGCNPIPLESRREGDMVVVEIGDLMNPEAMAKMHGHI